MSDATDPLAEVLRPWLDLHERPCWVPVIGEATDATSHYGGLPLMHEDEAWPTCGVCGVPLTFFLQIDLSEAPQLEGLPDEGLLQFFCCTRWESKRDPCSTWNPDSTSYLIRVLDEVPSARREHLEVEVFDRHPIVGWTQHDDVPTFLEDTNPPLDVDFDAHTIDHAALPSKVQFDVHSTDTFGLYGWGLCERDDKLGGWPCWEQGPYLPALSCKVCRDPLQQLFQINSRHHTQFMFGDVGRGHGLYCPNHPHVTAFTWQGG